MIRHVLVHRHENSDGGQSGTNVVTSKTKRKFLVIRLVHVLVQGHENSNGDQSGTSLETSER